MKAVIPYQLVSSDTDFTKNMIPVPGAKALQSLSRFTARHNSRRGYFTLENNMNDILQYGLTVTNKMAIPPYLKPGDKILCSPKIKPKKGDMVLAQLHDGDFTIGFFHEQEGAIHVQNASKSMVSIKEEINLVHKVTGIQYV